MTIASTVLAVLLIAVCVGSSVADFRRSESIVATMTRLKVPTDSLVLLGVIKVLAAVGLAAGFLVDRLDVVTGVALCLYFAVAVSTHVRVRDGVRNTLPSFVVLVACLLFVLTTIAA